MSKKNEKFNDYKAFVEKFEPKRTTDDCYTPPAVYDAVLKYVLENYPVPQGARIMRPFRPGGDYQAEDYTGPCIVVDNPPFSIMAQILDFYQSRQIPFFLFAPQLLTLGTVLRRPGLTLISTDVTITYENGANVATAFITNMSPDIVFKTAPQLHQSIKLTQVPKKRQKRIEYPDNIFNVKKAVSISRNGKVDFSLAWDQIIPFTKCSPTVKDIFGGACLISDEKAKEANHAALLAQQIIEPDEYITLEPHDLAQLDQLNKKISYG